MDSIEYEKVNGFIDFDNSGNIVVISQEQQKPPEPQKHLEHQNTNPLNEIKKSNKYRINMGQFECNICHKKFMRKAYCENHMLSHEKSNLFECEICNKTFMHKYHLNQHMKIHRDKQEKCEICGAKMFYKFNMDKHRKTHLVYTNKYGETTYM